MRKLLVFLLALPIICIAEPIEESISFNNMYNMFKDLPSETLEENGSYYLDNEKLDSALVCYTIISSRYIGSMNITEKQRCARAFNDCGLIYFLYSNYSKAYTNYLKALEICEESRYDVFLPTIYSNVSHIFSNYGDRIKTSEFLEKAYEQSLRNKDWQSVLIMIFNMTGIYFPYDSIYIIEDKLHEVRRLNIPHDNLYYYVLYTSNGMLETLEGNYDEAIANFEQTLDYTDNLWMSARYVYNAYCNIAQTYKSMNRYDSAIVNMQKAEIVARNDGYIDLMLDSYKMLANYYQAAGDEKNSMDYKYRYLHINDSIYNAREFAKIKDMQSLFELEKIEMQVHRLTNEKKLREMILTITLAALVIIAFLLFWMFWQNRRLLQVNTDLFKKNMEVMTSEETEKRLRKEYELRMKGYEEKLSQMEKASFAEPAVADGGEEEIKNKVRYKSSGLSEEHKAALRDSIRAVMNDPAEFCSLDFSLDRLVALVNSNSTYVSQAINETFHKNFNALLAECRISEARKRLIDLEHYGNLTIEAIAADLGFKSRGNFNQIFKKVTGLTPTEYQKIARRHQGGSKK